MASTRETSERTVIDWDLAISTAQRLARPGPEVSREEARKTVADLRRFATVAEGHVRDYTGLTVTAASAPVIVVDRRGWVSANADSFREVLAPLTRKLQQKRTGADGGSGADSLIAGLGSRVTGLEVGAVLAFLSGKVLGQFDPFWNDGTPVNGSALFGGTAGATGNGSRSNGATASTTPGAEAGATSNAVEPAAGVAGRLLLVAPNVVHVERELDVDPEDFRLWVCLHEETHRVQFTATPWLRGYLRDQIGTYLQQTQLDASALFAQLRESFDQVGRILRGDDEAGTLIDLVQTPEQKEILDRLTAVMSLLEGHADVVMDGVGPEVIPTVATIRERFQQRRRAGTFGDQLLKRLLGLDAKMRQYRDGARFVRHVVERVDMAGFNRVWESPETLPTRAEITDPDGWLRRVHAAT